MCCNFMIQLQWMKVVSWGCIHSWWRCCEDCWTMKNWEHYTNSLDKAIAGFERPDSHFGRNSNVGKLLPNSIACYQEIFMKWRINQCSKLHCCLIFKNFAAFPTSSTISQQQSTLRQDLPPAKSLQLAEGSDEGYRILAIKDFSIKICTFSDIMLLHI